MREIMASQLAGLILLAGCSPKASESKATDSVGQEFRRGLDEAKAPLPFLGEAEALSISWPIEWNLLDIDGMQILAGLSYETADSEPYTTFHGYVFNQPFKEWRRFSHIQVRNIRTDEIEMDLGQQMIYLLAADNRYSSLVGKRVLQIDLNILSDDRAYVRASEDPRPSAPEVPPDPDK